MRKTGNAGPLIALASAVTVAASHYVGAQALGKSIADQISQIGSMVTTQYQADIKTRDNQASLELQKFQDKSGKTQANSTAKEDYKKLLDAALDAQKRASQTG